MGRADVAIAGGTEAWLTPLGIASFCLLRAVSTRDCPPAEASRPFDRYRDGFVPAEGAAALVLEASEHAEARGAKVLAEIAGSASTSDAYNVLSPLPSAERAAACISLALADADLKPEAVSCIAAHGTSTPLNDVAETRAIKIALGAQARHVPVTAAKSCIGHALGAGGAIEIVAAVMSIRSNIIPQTLNLTHADPDCDLDYVSEGARQADVSVVVKNSFAFGGQNVCVVLKKP